MNERNSSDPSGSKQQFLPWSSDLASKGPDPSNTGPIKSQVTPSGGLDWLQVSLYGGFSEESWPSLLCDLDRAKAIAEERGELVCARRVLGSSLMVRAAGARHGGYYCRWVVDWNGVQLHIVAGGKASDRRPTVLVVLTSEVLMAKGDKVAWDSACELLAELGFSCVRDVVSRVDLCVDLPDVDVCEFVQPLLDGFFVARASKRAVYWDGRHATGFALGSNIRLRVYDKVRELREKGSDAKWQALVERWGKEPTKATRVEYQCRRDVLRDQFSIEGVDDLWAKMPALVSYLTKDWFRFTSRPVEHNHYSRVDLLGLWEQVREKFIHWAGNGPLSICKRVRKAIAPGKLVEQARGCFVSCLAMMGRAGDPWDALLGEVCELLYPDRHELARAVVARQEKFVATGQVFFDRGDMW